MASLNKVLLIGNLTRDPDLRYTSTGTAVANLRLAVNRTFVVQGDKREETLFIDVVAWGKQAEACGEYLAKGSAIFVDGRLQSREYEVKDGGKRTVIEVVADTVQFLTRKSGGPPAAGAGAEIPTPSAEGADDDVPF
jgi:single-strand DNA-binding protein